jgi:hypothetical protein
MFPTYCLKIGKCWRAGRYAAPQGGVVQAPHNTAQPNPLPDLTKRNTGTRRDHLPHSPSPNKNSPETLMLKGTQHPTGTLFERIPGYGMRPRYNREPNAWPHPLADRRRTPSLPMIHSVKHREQSEANHMGKQNGAKRSGGEGAPKSVRLPPLPRRQRPPPYKTNNPRTNKEAHKYRHIPCPR